MRIYFIRPNFIREIPTDIGGKTTGPLYLSTLCVFSGLKMDDQQLRAISSVPKATIYSQFKLSQRFSVFLDCKEKKIMYFTKINRD